VLLSYNGFGRKGAATMAAHRKNKNITTCNRIIIGAAGALMALGLSSGVASADVVEISADGIVTAQSGSTVREVGASGTNQVRSVSRNSVLSGLPGSKIVDSLKAKPGTCGLTTQEAVGVSGGTYAEPSTAGHVC